MGEELKLDSKCDLTRHSLQIRVSQAAVHVAVSP